MTPMARWKHRGRRYLRWVLSGLLAGALHVHAEPTPDTPDCPSAPTPLTEPEVQAGWRQAVDRGLLWQLDKDGRRSWLYGTIHAAQRDWMFPGPQVRAALAQAQRVALELDPLDERTQRQLQRLMSASPDEPPLPVALQQRLAQRATQECAGSMLTGLRPEFQLTLLNLLALRREGMDPAYGIDGFLAGLARGLNKRIDALETPAQQVQALLAPDATQRQHAVAHALDDLDNGALRRQGRRLGEAWARSDLDALSRYAEWCECLDTPAERAALHRLLDARHPAMVQRIAAWHDAGLSVFVTVGSLHLTGPQGLPALLAARGFRVTQLVPVPPPSAQSSLEPVPSPMPEPGDRP